MIDDFGPSGTPPMVGERLNVNEWLTYLASYQFGPVMPTKVVLHHTWRPTVAQWQGATSMKGMQRYFAGMGWTAAPHLFAAPDGIWLFTPLRELGVHAGTGNGSFTKGWYTIGLEMVGDYDNERPSGPVWENTLAILGGMSLRLGIRPSQLISFHRDYSSKTCPGKAVTPDWVIGQVEEWLTRNTRLPAIKPGAIGQMSPSTQKLHDILVQASWRRFGDGFSPASHMHLKALDMRLGSPLGRERNITFENRSYLFVPFALDSLFKGPGWDNAGSMWQTIGSTVPAEKTFERLLLDETMRVGGTGFRPDNPFHLYMFANRDVGPPLRPAGMVEINNLMYVYQIFAGETLYVQSNDPTNVDWRKLSRLSYLGGRIDEPAVTIRDGLLSETYRQMESTYHTSWQFHQLARAWAIGTPIGLSQNTYVDGTQYMYQVYAHDVLFVKVPEWQKVHRLSTLQASARRRNPIGSL